MDARRLEWVAGRIESLRLGGYGCVVHLRATASGVIVQTVTPRKQETLRPNSRAVRELALRVADAIIAHRNGGTRAAKRRRPQLELHGLLTPREIWLALLSSKLQPLPRDILDWGRSELVQHYRKLDAESRAALPSVDTVNNILTAARALDRRGVVPLDCDFDTLEAGVITAKLQAWVLEGCSAEGGATVSV